MTPPKLTPIALSLALALSTACRRDVQAPSDASAGRGAEILPGRDPAAPIFAATREAGPALSLADVAAIAIPSVVNVSAMKRAGGREQGQVPFPFGPFHRFFGPDEDAPTPRRARALGSGVVVAQGIVLTNAHVVQDATQIRVTTPQRAEYDAVVAGTDPRSDLAVLRIQGDASALRPIAMGASSRARLGDVVLAIGNPFGLGQTVTMGIVSAVGRANVGIVDFEDFIQTDAAINPGNSGGALVDGEGNLIGINTAILSRTGGSLGIGFAIPTDMARPIMASLLERGRVVRGWLGVGIQDVDQDLARALGLPSTSGVLIADVAPDGPAAKAGLQRGDVILAVDGLKVGSTGELRNAIAAAGAERPVKLDLIRKGQPKSASVTLGELPVTEVSTPEPAPATPASALDGITVAPLAPASRKRLGVPETVTGGVVVASVEPDSGAADAGLRPGDVVLEVDHAPIASVPAMKQAWERSKGPTLLLVHRGDRRAYVVVRR